MQTDPDYEPHREMAASAGYRAVQSTPLISREGEPLGMLSTHYATPYRPSERDLRLLDLYARQAADFIEHVRREEALRTSEQRFRAIFETAGVSVWVADFSEVKQALDALRAQGVEDLRTYLADQPGIDFLLECSIYIRPVLSIYSVQVSKNSDKGLFLYFYIGQVLPIWVMPNK